MSNISILIPTYNRRNFYPLIVRNLKCQDYDHEKLEVIIDDDSPIKLNKEELSQLQMAIYPIKLIYLKYPHKRSIGEKRNNLVKNAKNKIVCFMDTDDFYQSTYISHSYQVLKETGAGCVGSNKLFMFYPPYTNDSMYFLTCGDNKELIHECTIMFTKKWFNSSPKFKKNNIGEGKNLFIKNIKNVALTDPMKIMFQLCHDNNTIDKKDFKDNKVEEINIPIEITEFISKVVGVNV